MKLPLFEIGAAAVIVHSADYPASNESSQKTLVVPTFVYRGSKVRQDKRGTRARFYKNENFMIDLGTGLSLPTNSDRNEAREGMDDLNFVLEIGPRFIYTIFENDLDSLLILLPYRFAIATDFSHTKEIGTRINPEIEYTRALSNSFRVKFGFEMNYASEVYNDYIYEVSGRDVNANREEYDAKAGYIGSSLTAAIVYKGARFVSFLGLSYNRYDDSANRDSPLYKTKEGSGIAFGFNYFFYQSDRKGDKAVGVE